MRIREAVWTVAEPISEPVSLEDFKAHARIDVDAEDATLEGFLAAAVSLVERETQRLLTPREITMRLPFLPPLFEPLEVPGGAVVAVESIVVDGATVSADAYQVFGTSPAQIYPLVAWPVVTGRGLPVVITYTAGYETPPADLLIAVKMLAAEMEQRRSEGETGSLSRVPVGAARAISRHRIWCA